MIKYKIEVSQYTNNTKIFSNCNSITFINTGAVSVKVNNVIINTGNSLVIAGNANEMDITEYNLDFTNIQGEITVIRKINL